MGQIGSFPQVGVKIKMFETSTHLYTPWKSWTADSSPKMNDWRFGRWWIFGEAFPPWFWWTFPKIGGLVPNDLNQISIFRRFFGCKIPGFFQGDSGLEKLLLRDSEEVESRRFMLVLVGNSWRLNKNQRKEWEIKFGLTGRPRFQNVPKMKWSRQTHLSKNIILKSTISHHFNRSHVCFFSTHNTCKYTQSWKYFASLLLKMFYKINTTYPNNTTTTTTSVVSPRCFRVSNCLVSWAPAPTASRMDPWKNPTSNPILKGDVPTITNAYQALTKWDDPPSTKMKNPNFRKPITTVLPYPKRITIKYNPPKFNSSPLKNDASKNGPFLSGARQMFRGLAVKLPGSRSL